MLIAAAGFLAVAMRAVIAGLLVLRHGVAAFLARDLGATRARRGDLTGLADAASDRALARRRRLAAVGVLCMWAVLLVVPLLTPWPVPLYACYSLFWLVPRRRKTVQHT